MSSDIFDRLTAANPMPDEATKPDVLWSQAVLRDVIEERRGNPESEQASEGPPQSPKHRWNGALIAAAAFVVVMIVGIASLLSTRGDGEETALGDAERTTDLFKPEAGGGRVPTDTDEPFDLGPPVDASGAVANFTTTAPDFAGVLPGDDGVGPLALGVVSELPGEDYLNFLFEFCQPECYRDAHFMDPNNPRVGSGPWTAGRPFHVRHGFINNGDEPLGEGFDVVMYITRWGEGSDSEAFVVGQTYKFTSDYVLRGSSDECGPTYKTQTGFETCEWFIHDFADGLPPGRYDLWAVWEAPCSAWVGLGFTDGCGDPNEVVSLFSAGVNSPFGEFEPSFSEVNEAKLSPDEIAELYGNFEGDMGFEELPPRGPEVEIDASGAAATAGTPLPDFDGAVAGDDGADRLPLGTVAAPAYVDRLDFLFEPCCSWRDARFVNPEDPSLSSAAWQGGRPFHVRHGFINESEEPLSDDFDVVLYVYQWDDFAARGTTYRYTSDYVLRGTTDQCGPTYNSLTEPVTCEWFVHEFHEGLPIGRHALWAFWEAPCSAWVNYGFVDSCADPNEIMSLFASGVDSPWESSAVIWD